jgi:HPt (histidine-containing phosphotransfer) domain-containing protein
LRELRELAESSDDPGEFRELIDLFLGELDSGLASMRKALAQGNGEELTKLAHSLKGASASMGAGGLALLCRTLEETAMNTDLPGAEVQLKQIEREVYIVRETLEKESSG